MISNAVKSQLEEHSQPEILFSSLPPRQSLDMPSTTLPSLSEDEIDDLLYFARTGELSDLKTSVEAFAKAANASQSDIIVAAVDSFSGNGPLHMASANGHLGMS